MAAFDLPTQSVTYVYVSIFILYTMCVFYLSVLYVATVMQGVSLNPQHPLILAYYCISMINPTEKFVKVGIIPLIVHHLKVMEISMTLTEVS